MKRISKYTFVAFVLLFGAAPQSFLQAQELKTIKFADLESIMTADTQKVKVINFWATWCKPCIEEMPSFETIAQNYRLRSVEVYLVSMDFISELDRVKRFVERKGLKSEVMLLDEPDYDSWINKVHASWSGALPATVLISGEKKEFYEQKLELAELQSNIERLLN